MSAIKRWKQVSVEDYLASEFVSPTKHEFVGGVVYAKAGARNAHSAVAGNVFAHLHGQLRGKPCRPFNSDTKIRIRLPSHTRFYCPDASIVCRPNPQTDSFQDEPAVIVEVLSRRTRRTDEGEKKEAYLTIPSLLVYALIEHEMPAVVIFRRTDGGFREEVHEGLDASVPLLEIGATLPLTAVYEGVEFSPEPDPSENV